MNTQQYLFDQQQDQKPTDTLLDKVRIEKNNFIFSADLISAEFGQPTMFIAVEDKNSGFKATSAQFKLGFSDIAANSYGSATFENSKDGTKIQLICKTVEKNVSLPGNVN